MDTAESETLDESIAYRTNANELCARLATDVHRGLSEAEARTRLTHYGRNELAAEQPIAPWRRFLSQFQDVLVILLLVATGVSAALWAFERDAALPYEAIAILAVVLLNAAMGFLQESRAEAAIAALGDMFCGRRVSDSGR